MYLLVCFYNSFLYYTFGMAVKEHTHTNYHNIICNIFYTISESRRKTKKAKGKSRKISDLNKMNKEMNKDENNET